MNRNGVRETILDNGLRILTKELHHAPVTSFWVWYRVGSRNEVPGITGVSHWVEHMMFKGTEQFPKGEIDRQVSRLGGLWNAFTWVDFTAYFATMPADRIDLSLRLEADRMINSQFDPQEVESERTVILSELHMYENYPTFMLRREVTATALHVRSYRHETIGWESDLKTMTRDDLYRHYRTYYVPNNAIAIAIGDFETEAMVDRIAELYGSILPGPTLEAVYWEEPPQRGERRVEVHGPGSTPYLMLAYHAPAATDDDWWALAVADTILGGPQSFNLFGGAPNSRSSRLYRALVDRGLAASVGASLTPTIDPYLYGLSVTLIPSAERAEVERVVTAEIDRLRDEPISEAELEKARKQTRAQFAFSSESVTSQGYWMGFSSTVADLAWFENFLDRVEAVTAADIQRVAQRYLLPSARTVGWYLPDAT
ncbi:MAG TPA: pitrilysin family protein [Ardenticatenaceae bacterium]|nr:pitrilysin family protein [Ardenticatenaceae bacterium]